MNVSTGPRERTILPATDHCRACGADGLVEIARGTGLPVNNARVFRERDEARGVPVGEMQLAVCPSCGFIANMRFDPGLVVYDSTYEEQQSYSPTFTAFADGLASELVARWNLHGKRLVEIGCGKGDFLAALCAIGGNDGIGIDPSAVRGRLNGAGAERVTLVPEMYSARSRPLEADAVFCRHTLEHIADVAGFVRALRRSLEGRPGTRVFFEVPDAMRVLREGAFWDVYYEHCSYFTPGSLARLFRREGFVVDDVRLGFEDQYVLLDAHAAAGGNGTAREGRPHPAEDAPADLLRAGEAYAARVGALVAYWRRRIGDVRAAGGRVAIWGSGSKCVAFLSETGVGPSIDAVVDVNPHRQGRYLPGSGRIVAAPDALSLLRPALVIIMNSVYRVEIAASLHAMDVDAQVEAV